MRDVPIENPDPADLGPSMLALTPLQRRFVLGWVRSRGKNGARIARAAGYSDAGEAAKVKAHYLLRNPRILAALREEADRHLDGIAVLAVLGLGDLINSKNEKTRQVAVDSVLDRTGYGRQSQHKVQVEHTDARSTTELMALVEKYRAGRALPAPIEGEFKEVARGKVAAA